MSFYQDGTVLTAAELDAAFAVKEPSIPAGTTSQFLRGDKTWQTLDKNDVGLTNVDNTADVDKPVSTAQAAADSATLASAKSYADGLMLGLFDFRGNYDASSGTFPTTGGSGTAGAVVKADIWRISVAGTLGGVALRVGDSIYATIDTPAQVSSNWATIQLELGYNPEDVSRKAADLSSNDNVHYPTTAAVQTAINAAKLQYWSEASQTVSSTVQRLIWQPKDPNGTFVRANTVQVLAVPKALTLRDPSESGSTFPTGFTAGLDLQMKGGTGTASTFAGAGSYAFGEGNTVSDGHLVTGIGNISTKSTIPDGYVAVRVSVVSGIDNSVAANNSIVIGARNNIKGWTNLVLGQDNSITGTDYSRGILVGNGNSCEDNSIDNLAFGIRNAVANHGIAFGSTNTSVNGVVFGASNVATTIFGPLVTLGAGNKSIQGKNNVLVGISNTAPDESVNSVSFGISNLVNAGVAIGVSNTSTAAIGGFIAGTLNKITSGSYCSAVIIGKNNSIGSGGALSPIILSMNSAATAPTSSNTSINISSQGSIQTSGNSIVISRNPASDQGISGFQQFGRTATILVSRINVYPEGSFTDFTWYDIPNTVFQALGGVTGAVTKYSANVYISWRDSGGTTTLNQNRQGILKVEAWITDLGTLVQSIHVVEGGDADISAYFDVRIVLSGNGVKLQYRFVSDPTGGQQIYDNIYHQNGVKANLKITGTLTQTGAII